MNWTVEIYFKEVGQWCPLAFEHNDSDRSKALVELVQHGFPTCPTRVLAPNGKVVAQTHAVYGPGAKNMEVIDGGTSMVELTRKLHFAEATRLELKKDLDGLQEWQKQVMVLLKEYRENLSSAEDVIEMLTDADLFDEEPPCPTRCAPDIKTSGNTDSSSVMEEFSREPLAASIS